MRTTLLTLLLLLATGLAHGAGGASYPNDSAPVDLNDEPSLQRGAKLFVNYCMGCHSAKFQRYSRLARDLDISEDAVLDNLVFDENTKIGDHMTIAMTEDDGEQWFGAAPPDLSLIARSRGADYLYNYLRGFYLDETRPLGVNNSVKVVNMPHVLWQMEGWKKPVYEDVVGADGKPHATLTGFEKVVEGSMSDQEFDAAMGDLVNFLVYVGEPIQQQRKRQGVWVLLFLFLALIVFYLLKKEYWKDVH